MLNHHHFSLNKKKKLNSLKFKDLRINTQKSISILKRILKLYLCKFYKFWKLNVFERFCNCLLLFFFHLPFPFWIKMKLEREPNLAKRRYANFLLFGHISKFFAQIMRKQLLQTKLPTLWSPRYAPLVFKWAFP